MPKIKHIALSCPSPKPHPTCSAHTLDSATQKSRSLLRIFGRVTVFV